MVRFVYCVTENPLGETKEIIFSALSSAMKFINDNKRTLLSCSAGYTVYSVVNDGELPDALFSFTR